MQPTKDRTPQTEHDFHRKIAAECFNRTWDYLEEKNRTPEDDQMMLNLAHASRYHWGLIGKPWNLTTGDWQISRVYAALNQPDLALRFAKTALEISQKNSLSERLVSAYEGMARAYAVGKRYRNAKLFVNKARDQLRAVSLDVEDRKTYSDQIDETERMIQK
jgi:tetratricopeptide (TPR) repeat protein